MTEADIRAYLYYGYVPRVNSQDPFWILENWDRGEAKRRLENLSCHELIAEGARALQSAMQGALDELGGSQHQHVVMLSGGSDSRAVLGGLLDRFSSSEICAATFGLPGFPDFDLARRLTKSVGLRHELIDPRNTACTTELLTRCMKQTDPTPYHPILHGPYLTYVLRSQLGTKVTYWNGFLGDPLAGARLPAEMPHAWDISTRLFARSNRWGGVERPGYDPVSILPRNPLAGPAQMTYPDQLDFAVRQPYCIYTRSKAGHKFARLFQQSSWVNFMLNVPIQYRYDQTLYREILKSTYPRLFRIPTTHQHGVPLTASSWKRTIKAGTSRAQRWLKWKLRAHTPSVLRYMLRTHAAIVEENLVDLQKRGTVDWLDVLQIWRDHQGRARYAAQELNALVSLEANLKAEEQT